VYYDLPMDDPDRGRGFPCDCTKKSWEEQRRQRLFNESGLGALQRMTFDNFSCRKGEISDENVPNLTMALCDVEEYAQLRWPQGWILLAGNYGCGKTHLAAAAVNLRITNGWPANLVVVPDFLDHLRSAFSPSADTQFDDHFERIKLAEFLVLDDLGAEYGTPWATEKLFQLVNYRYNSQLPTIFTTNVPTEDIEPRIRSRLLDKQLTVSRLITAPDYRLTKAGLEWYAPSIGEVISEGNAIPSAAATATTARRTRRSRRDAQVRQG
jgi:DNA replication protein DnaC